MAAMKYSRRSCLAIVVLALLAINICFSIGWFANVRRPVARTAVQREDDRSAVQLQKLSKDPMLEKAKCHRFGKPFHSIQLSSLVFAFQATTSQVSSEDYQLLLYAQNIHGVFHPRERQFIAAVLGPNGTTLDIVVKRKSTRQVRVKSVLTSLEGQFADGQWHAVAVCLGSDQPMIASVASENVPTNESLLMAMQEFNVSSPQALLPLDVDSGVYIGGTVDMRSLTMTWTDYEGRPKAFKGQFHSQLMINSREIDLPGTDTYPVMPQDAVRDQYSKVDLTQPIRFKGAKVDTDTSDPAVQLFPVAGGISDNHVQEAGDMIMSVRKVMGERGVLIYDLGLKAENVKLLNSYCNTTVRHSVREDFPELMRVVFDMRWKPVVINSVLQEFGGVLYADASIRFRQTINTIGVFQNGYGFVGFGPKDTSPTGGFTHDGTLKALAVPRHEVAEATLTIGGVQIWLDRPELRMTVLKQLVGCAMQAVCMRPAGALLYGCNFKKKGVYYGCHRYDQSAISVILWKAFKDSTAVAYQLNHPNDLRYVGIERTMRAKYARCTREPRPT